MGRGRPTRSVIRDRMQQIVDALGVTYGYEIFKVYTDAFSPIALRSMYYHLNKGIGLDEFVIVGVKQEKGDFTWGDVSIRKYYVLGPSAKQKASDDLHIVIKTLGLGYRELNKYVDWTNVLEQKTKALEQDISALLKKGKPDEDLSASLDLRISSAIDWFEVNKKKPKRLIELYGSFKGSVS